MGVDRILLELDLVLLGIDRITVGLAREVLEILGNRYEAGQVLRVFIRTVRDQSNTFSSLHFKWNFSPWS